MQPADVGADGIVQVDRQRVAFLFSPDVPTFDEQSPGYYQVRIASSMLVSRRREPDGPPFDRHDACGQRREPPTPQRMVEHPAALDPDAASLNAGATSYNGPVVLD